jgi:hypothetical protein
MFVPVISTRIENPAGLVLIFAELTHRVYGTCCVLRDLNSLSRPSSIKSWNFLSRLYHWQTCLIEPSAGLVSTVLRDLKLHFADLFCIVLRDLKLHFVDLFRRVLQDLKLHFAD